MALHDIPGQGLLVSAFKIVAPSKSSNCTGKQKYRKILRYAPGWN